jgi:AraC family transcriptional regulator of adaptative response/methylated-DNA-[protein]-cysteine methyltransferase
MGISPRQYLAARKFGNFKTLVRKGESVTQFALRVGIQLEQPSLRTRLGRTRHDARDLQSRRSRREYQLHDSDFPMGRLLVAVTERGVCAVRMADSDAELEKDLREEFPHAQIKRDDSLLREPVQKILIISKERAASRSPARYQSDCVSASGLGKVACDSVR